MKNRLLFYQPMAKKNLNFYLLNFPHDHLTVYSGKYKWLNHQFNPIELCYYSKHRYLIKVE